MKYLKPIYTWFVTKFKKKKQKSPDVLVTNTEPIDIPICINCGSKKVGVEISSLTDIPLCICYKCNTRFWYKKK